MQKSKGLTFFLSFVPGLGHFYLGLMNRGLQVMIAFFSLIFLTNTLNGLGFLIPVLWFFSLFDALQQHGHVNASDEPIEYIDRPFIEWGELKNRKDWIGWALIILGVFFIFERMTIYFFDIHLLHFMKNVIIGLLFVGLGAMLVTGRNVFSQKSKESTHQQSQLTPPADDFESKDGTQS